MTHFTNNMRNDNIKSENRTLEKYQVSFTFMTQFRLIVTTLLKPQEQPSKPSDQIHTPLVLYPIWSPLSCCYSTTHKHFGMLTSLGKCSHFYTIQFQTFRSVTL